MPDRPYTLLSCAMSIDGYLDTAGPLRLRLSNDEDVERVDAERASCDAILVGAATIRRDNPRLLVRSAERRAWRESRGLAPSPAKVTVTRTGELDSAWRFFACDGPEKLVYCAADSVGEARRRLGAAGTVVDAGHTVSLRQVAEDLHARGVRRLMVEGGRSVLTQMLTDDLVDELQLVVAPFFVGDSAAPRLVGDGPFPWSPERRARLAGVREIGDVVLLRYALSARFGAD